MPVTYSIAEYQSSDMLRRFLYNLKLEDKKRGLTREEFAKLVGISPASYYTLIAGRINTNVLTIEKISRNLSVDWTYMLRPIPEFFEHAQALNNKSHEENHELAASI